MLKRRISKAPAILFKTKKSHDPTWPCHKNRMVLILIGLLPFHHCYFRYLSTRDPRVVSIYIFDLTTKNYLSYKGYLFFTESGQNCLYISGNSKWFITVSFEFLSTTFSKSTNSYWKQNMSYTRPNLSVYDITGFFFLSVILFLFIVIAIQAIKHSR